jgi:predicted SAM-dependent methyltransferase
MVKLNLGCGSVQPQGWVNVDYSLGARLSEIPFYNFINRRMKLFDIDPDGHPRVWDDKIYIHNLNKKFPWENNSVDIIYCSHTLEHFSKQEGLTFLRECHRIMKKGGILRIIVPDLKNFVEEYAAGKMRADDFVANLGVLYEKKNNRLKNLLMTISQFPHRCMYDTEALSNILTSIGFVVESKQPFKSDIPDIRDIEWGERTEHAVIVEGKKN